MWQQVVVALIVVAALVRFVRHYLPAALRRRLVQALTRCGLDQNKLARFFNTTERCGTGCGSCGGCDSGTPKSATKHADTGTAGPQQRVIMLRRQH